MWPYYMYIYIYKYVTRQAVSRMVYSCKHLKFKLKTLNKDMCG